MKNEKRTTEPAPSVPAPKSTKAIVRFAIIVVLAVAGDLLLKWYAFENVAGIPIDREVLRESAGLAIPPHDPVTVVPGVLSLHLTVNHGAVFGIGQGGRWIFVVIAVVACAIIARVFWVSRAKDWLLHAALALITGGALGNLYDRFFFGMVRDMLLLLPETNLPFGWAWPGGSRLAYPWIFNLADAALCVGIGVIVVSMLFGRHQDTSTSSQQGKTESS
jgi:signal peptidase II